LCPVCERFYGVVDRESKEKLRKERQKKREQERVAEAKKHGIDLRYELAKGFEAAIEEEKFRQEFLGTWIPEPRTTVIMFRCEQRPVSNYDKHKWNKLSQASDGRYRYTQGWVIRDPAGVLKGAFNIRPCMECVRWPDNHFIEDLDAHEAYETEKERSQPAFSLKAGKRKPR
jgi:hypothetical protein